MESENLNVRFESVREMQGKEKGRGERESEERRERWRKREERRPLNIRDHISKPGRGRLKINRQ